jgi:hypothetical protein
VWAPVGERPVALGHHRFEWLYVTGFVEPATGRTVWNVANGISKAYFELVLADFAKSVGAGPDKRIVLQLDNAGWHGPENLTVPDGIRLVFQPAHSRTDAVAVIRLQGIPGCNHGIEQGDEGHLAVDVDGDELLGTDIPVDRSTIAVVADRVGIIRDSRVLGHDLVGFGADLVA